MAGGCVGWVCWPALGLWVSGQGDLRREQREELLERPRKRFGAPADPRLLPALRLALASSAEPPRRMSRIAASRARRRRDRVLQVA